MEERKRFIEDWLRGGATNLAALCRLYEISRKTGYKWIERFEAGGLPALEERSHAAHLQPRRIAAAVEKRLIAARRRHPTWGPKKLRAWLRATEPETAWPAASTIGEALRRAGLVTPRKRVRRLVDSPPGPLREPETSNDVWTLDHKGQFRTGDGALCYPLTVADGYSRYLPACEAHGGTSYQAARGSLERLFRERGLPRRVRSDNGSPFASTGAGRLTRLSVWWLKLGIEVERIEPGKPQQNGRHERLHRTLKAETARPPAQGPAGATATLRPFSSRVQRGAGARGAGPENAGGDVSGGDAGILQEAGGSGVSGLLGAPAGAPRRAGEARGPALLPERSAAGRTGRLGGGGRGAVAGLVRTG